jgi:5-methylcytosine-specific restriction protein A
VDDLRPAQLLREPFCRECAQRGIRTAATDVDHIRDHKGDWALFTDRDNLESLCHSCHSRKTMRENRKNRK